MSEQELEKQLEAILYDQNAYLDYADDEPAATIAKLKALITKAVTAARREAIYAMHDSIMRHELELGIEPDPAFNYARVHSWIDRIATLEAERVAQPKE